MCTYAYRYLAYLYQTVEAERADALEAELGRVRVTVKGRVRALKAALEEAEEDADR